MKTLIKEWKGQMLAAALAAFTLSFSAGENNLPNGPDQSSHAAQDGALENQVLENKQALDALMHAAQGQTAPVSPVITSLKRNNLKNDLAYQKISLEQLLRPERLPLRQASAIASGEAKIYKSLALGIGSFSGVLGVAAIGMGAAGGIAAVAIAGGVMLGGAAIVVIAFLVKAALASNTAEETDSVLQSDKYEFHGIKDRIKQLEEELSVPESGLSGPNQGSGTPLS